MLDVGELVIIELTAPFRWDRAVFNTGELVDLPVALARPLIEAGHAHERSPASETLAVDGPPANKLMTQKTKKQARANAGATLEDH